MLSAMVPHYAVNQRLPRSKGRADQFAKRPRQQMAREAVLEAAARFLLGGVWV
jgi:hypothetical protein